MLLLRRTSSLFQRFGIQAVRTMSDTAGQKRSAPEESVSKPMEINNVVVEEYESSSLRDLKKAPVSALQGIGPVISECFETLGVSTVEDLANYKVLNEIHNETLFRSIGPVRFYQMAKSIVTLAGQGNGKRHHDCKMNINEALMKDSEEKSFDEIAASPLSILQGLTEDKGKLLEKVHVKTVKELADLKYIHWAEAICTLSEYEEDHAKKAKAA